MSAALCSFGMPLACPEAHAHWPVCRFATNFTECDLDEYDLPSGAGSRGKGAQQQHAPDSAATASLIGALGVGIGAAGGVDGAPMTRERFAAALQRAARDPLVIEKAFAQYLAFVTDGGVNDDAADVVDAEESAADVNGSEEQGRQVAGKDFGIGGGPLIPDNAAATVAPFSSGPSSGPVDALEQLRKFQEQQNAAAPAPSPAATVPLNNPPKMDALEQLRAFQQGPPPSLGGAGSLSAGGARIRGGSVGGLAALGLGGPLGQGQEPQQPQSGQNLVDKLAAMMQQQQHPSG